MGRKNKLVGEGIVVERREEEAKYRRWKRSANRE